MNEAFSIEELIECARRELGARRRVYRRMVLNEKMPGTQADREIALMEAIVQNLERQKEPELEFNL